MSYDKKNVIKHFDRAAETYLQNANVQQQIMLELLEHLDDVCIEPETILDLGSGPGVAAPLLKKRFPRATVVLLDLSKQMLLEAKRNKRFWQRQKHPLINADMLQLPFKPRQFDLIVSSLSMQWENNLGSLFQEVHQHLSVGGLFLFSSLGPQTMREIRLAWSEVDELDHVHSFYEIDQYGDELMRAGFLDPVLLREMKTESFDSIKSAIASIRTIGATNVIRSRRKTLTPRKQWQAFLAAYEKQRVGKQIPLSYEVYYALAWAGQTVASQTEVTVPLTSIKPRKT